ncbi:DNA-(apurinic or apyrimidinic site) lyase [Iris pallida]|uniref:DNA-(Apurinic or apyrimidinic site) lyase n=1 Tax=Iris pallida TaxID=29817 RepID=A0AAX6GIW0_IRIPA|nr:DNA-(apurinic or apyrimidinic site) lyase [Iris pallida]
MAIFLQTKRQDCGQPGFTMAERQRFSNILCQGKLIDAYRYLHEEQDMECGFSWSGNPIGKYRGKRMRIDYFILSEQLKGRIVACKMHGQGIELKGFFAVATTAQFLLSFLISKHEINHQWLLSSKDTICYARPSHDRFSMGA